MSNLLKSKTLKVGGLVIAIAMMVGVVSTTASAQTSTTTTTVVASGYTYSGVMKAGMSGPGISTLQAALNEVNAGTTVVVDGKFGPATKAAVMKFQMAHGLTADGVVGPKTGAALAAATVAVITVPGNFPAGCTSNAGYSTTTGQSCAVSMTLPAGCTSTSGYSTTTGVKCDTGSSSNNNNGSLSGGETDINGVNVNDADDDTLNEGSNKAPVAEIEFDVDDADAELVRADIVFQSTDNQVSGTDAGEEDKPWRVFEKVYLMDGNTVVASMDSDDEDAWDDADDTNVGSNAGDADAYRIRFNNVNKVYKEGDTASLWVAVDVASSVDGSDSSDAQWDVEIDTNGLRFTDGASLDTEVSSSDTAHFSIVESGADSEFSVTQDDSSPDAQTLEVKSNTSSTQTVAIFTVDTDEDGGDVKLNDFPVTLTLGNAGGKFLADVVDDVMVLVDGTEYSADQNPSSSLTTQEFTFEDIEDDDVVIDAGDDMNVTVKVKFRSQGSGTLNYANGVTITASVTGDASDVEDADTGDDVQDVDFTATGETMTLAGSGIMVDITSATTDITVNDALTTDDTATFTWKFDVSAFGDDVYLSRDFANIVAATTAANCTAAEANDLDYCYDIEESTGAALTGSGTITDNSDADEVTGVAGYTGTPYTSELYWKVSEGETESFTITVTATNSAQSKQVRAFLTGIEFTTDHVDSLVSTGTAPSTQIYSSNLIEDSQTPFKLIQ